MRLASKELSGAQPPRSLGFLQRSSVADGRVDAISNSSEPAQLQGVGSHSGGLLEDEEEQEVVFQVAGDEEVFFDVLVAELASRTPRPNRARNAAPRVIGQVRTQAVGLKDFLPSAGSQKNNGGERE